MYYGLRKRGHRRLTSFVLLVMVFSTFLSLGPRLPLLYDFLAAYYPGFCHLRNIYRFAVFVQLMIAALAAIGLHFLYGRCAKLAGSRLRTVAKFAFVAIAAFSVAEAAPPSLRLFNTTDLLDDNRWVGWLTDHTEPQSVVAFLPFPETPAIADYIPTAKWMYLQMHHRRRMVNGYSGVFPEKYLRLQASLSESTLREQAQQLADKGVDYVVLAELPTDLSGVSKIVFTDPSSGTTILRLR